MASPAVTESLVLERVNIGAVARVKMPLETVISKSELRNRIVPERFEAAILAVICVLLSILNEVTAFRVPPINTAVTESKATPVITTVPPATVLVGVKLVMEKVGIANTVN